MIPINDAANASSGFAFQDAASILQYRYGTNYANLSPFNSLYGFNAGSLFGDDFIDGYRYFANALMTEPIPAHQ